ncbi:glycosyl hydrolase [Telmatobacter sp. DSM 110680]|uniref:Glycosyl hydrolase n=1 Tax=Telmatobacter sp. DSM 110680 TaxID=3036704 RepID=A0AAU7DF62_9BACT
MTLFHWVWRSKPILAGLCLFVQASGLGGLSANKSEESSLRPLQFTIDFVGMHTLSPTRHWPDIKFGSIRPAGTSWGALEPAKGQFDWHSLDTWVAQSQIHHVQLDYVFVNTPQWASTRPNETCIGKKLGCAAPPNLDDLTAFVTALVTRYRGKISSYELWNEPNASGFWTGSPQQMVELAAHIYPLIKSIDPSATVTTPAVSSTGWPLSHEVWLDQYLAAGGGRFADAIAWHGYAGRNDRPSLPPEELAEQILALRKVLAKHSLARMPIWNTEGGWGKDAQLPDQNAQAAFIAKWYLINFTSGIARAYWYQWDNSDWGTLWRDGSGITPAGKAAQQVISWLEGTSAATPCRPLAGSQVWECDLQKGAKLYRVVWSSSGESTFSNVASIVSITTLDGSRIAADHRPITVTSEPMLLEYSETK